MESVFNRHPLLREVREDPTNAEERTTMARLSAAALRLVEDRETTPAPPGDLDLTRETMAQWRQGQRTCRARKRHNWGPYTVYEYTSHYEVTEQCSHCRNRRTADFSKTGHKLDRWRADYRDGYLLPKGAMRVDEELHDELMLGDILSRKVVAVADDDDG